MACATARQAGPVAARHHGFPMSLLPIIGASNDAADRQRDPARWLGDLRRVLPLDRQSPAATSCRGSFRFRFRNAPAAPAWRWPSASIDRCRFQCAAQACGAVATVAARPAFRCHVRSRCRHGAVNAGAGRRCRVSAKRSMNVRNTDTRPALLHTTVENTEAARSTVCWLFTPPIARVEAGADAAGTVHVCRALEPLQTERLKRVIFEGINPVAVSTVARASVSACGRTCR